jgi:hypothetical protein
MRTPILLAAFALASAALAFAPPAAAMQLPPPCQTLTTCCPVSADFAPCCTVLSCPPPIARCPETSFDSSDYIQWLGPWVTVATHYDCSATVCLETTCCTLDGTQSACSTLGVCLPPLAGAASAQTSLGVPRVNVVQNEDCTLTVTETMDSCPNGMVKSTIHYTAYPVHFELDQCEPVCACIPLAAAPAAPEESA